MIFIYLFLFSFSIMFSAENNENEILNGNNLQSFFSGPSNVGTDFWITIPPPYLESPSPSNFMRIIVGSSKDANVKLTNGSGLDKSMTVLAGTTKSFEVTPSEAQAYLHYYTQSLKGQPAQVWKDKALHITSDEAIIVYVVIRYSYTTDGYLAIPVDGLGKKYIATNYDAREMNSGSLPNMLCVVSPYDNTNVKFTLGGGTVDAHVEILGGNILNTGDSKEFIMNQGDVLVLSNVGPDETLSGSLIESDNDIAVFSANYCADIPLRVRACDYIVEQDLPMETWGKIYGIPSFSYRDKSSILRVFAKEDNTTLYRNGQELFYFVKGLEVSGGVQNESWFEGRIWPVGINPKPAIYSSDKPIYISLYNPGSQDDGKPSDPFSMIITPVEQYQNEILYSTPSAEGGQDFKDHYLNLIFECDDNGLVPDDMMLGIVRRDSTEWISVREQFGASADIIYEIGSGDDKNDFINSEFYAKKFAHKELSLPGEGVYKLKSSSFFTAFSSGVDSYDTYGFPTTGMFKFDSDDAVKPIISMSMDCNGHIIGNAEDKGKDIMNVVGLSTPKVDFENSSNFSNVIFNEKEFQPGQQTLDWNMNVVDPSKPATAVVYFSDRSGNYHSETIEFIPSGISIPQPEITHNGSLYLCDNNSSVELNVSNLGYAKVEWSTGESTETINVSKAGKYFVKVYDDNDCFIQSDEIEVIAVDEVNMNIAKSTMEDIICEGKDITLTALVDSEGEITWSNGEKGKSITINESGEYSYSFKMNDVDCEFNSKHINVEFTPLPEKPEIIYDNFTLKVETNYTKINWYVNGKIETKYNNKKEIAPETDGTHYAEVFEQTGTCSSISNEYNVNWMSVLDNVTEENISISPNPNNGNFNMNINTEIKGQVEFNIYDIKGQKVFSQKVTVNSQNYSKDFSLPNLTDGVYIFNVKTNTKEINKKFIVE